MKLSDHVRVVHVISGLGIGGAERLLLWAARYHDREMYPLGIISLMSGCELTSEIRETGVPLVELGQKRGQLTPAGFLMLLKSVQGFQPEILQGHMFHSNMLARFVRPLAGCGSSVINTIHNEWQSMPRNAVDALTARLCDGFITFSPQAEKVITKQGPARRPVQCIPYGIEVPPQFTGDREIIRARLGLPLDRFIWITVGSLTKQKAYKDLINAFSILMRHKTKPMLLVAGEGEEHAQIKKMIEEKDLRNNVHLLGLRRDVPDLLAASDAFVLSSHWEGNPLVILEAMAASLPVVATKVGMVHTMTIDGETAVLVEPRRPQLLAEAMMRVMEMENRARMMGEAGRTRLEEYYDFRRMQREVERFYDSILGHDKGDRHMGRRL